MDQFRNGVETIMEGILSVVEGADTEQAMHALAVVLTSLSQEVEEGEVYLMNLMAGMRAAE